MALKTPYATAVESDVFLAERADWFALTDAEKDRYLLNATYYMDKHYSCSFSDPIEDEAGYACALLGYHDFKTGLYTVDETKGGVVTEEEVVAKGVKSRVKYAGNQSTSSLGTVDKYPDATAVLAGICSLRLGGGLTRTKLIRT